MTSPDEKPVYDAEGHAMLDAAIKMTELLKAIDGGAS